MSSEPDELIRRTLGEAGKLDPAAAPRADAAAPLCPVDRMPRRRRNQICITIIVVGFVNFIAYTLVYAALGGDAHNGDAVMISSEDGGQRMAFYVRGHFIRSLEGQQREVSRAAWVYSYLHSISVLVTSAAMIISMLVLARPHIIATMRDSWISGRTFVTAFATAVVLISLVIVFVFIWDFATQLSAA